MPTFLLYYQSIFKNKNYSFGVLTSISTPSTEKITANDKTVVSEKVDKKDADKKNELEQKEADETARKQQEEQTKKQQEQQTASQAQPATESKSNVQYKHCTEVKNTGKAPLYSGQPGYSRKLDRDGDGVACER
ncbi:excalibur calcium-binding domain-containing protein [Bacillus cereus]|uniref:excalibur calcium-binding domain-containing protein n=1 Tax=Bacillus cereus TaxID=1396 RepID=UPI00396F6320